MALTEKTKAWLKANADVDLTGKTVLITGATSGVDFKTAETMVYIRNRTGSANGPCRELMSWQSLQSSICLKKTNSSLPLSRL